MRSKLLLDEPPLSIIPSLAEKIGLNESIILQQLHYWIPKATFQHDGKTWVYNTLADWQNQFKFWSVDTIKRTLQSLKKDGFIEVEQLSEDKRDKTNYYTINYSKIDELFGEAKTPAHEGNLHSSINSSNNEVANCTDASVQNAPIHEGNLHSSIKINLLTENTTENTSFNLPREKSRSKNKTSFPSDDSELKAYAIIKATDDGIKCPITTYESFKDHHIANGSKFNDWNRAFNLWARNFYQFKSENFKEKLDVNIDGYPHIVGTYSFEDSDVYDESGIAKMVIKKDDFIKLVIRGAIKPVGRAA